MSSGHMAQWQYTTTLGAKTDTNQTRMSVVIADVCRTFHYLTSPTAKLESGGHTDELNIFAFHS